MKTQFHPTDITLLRVFRVICECGGIAAAAERHDISASTLSTQLIQLESRLDLTLCKRGPSGFELLPEGQIVLEQAKKIFDEMQTFVYELSKLEDTLVGELKIGIIDNTITNPDFNLSSVMQSFCQQYPRVIISVEICRPEHIEQAALDGKYDIGIGTKQNQLPYLTYRPLVDEIQVVVCSNEHPFYNIPDSDLSAKKLRNARWLVDYYRFPLKFPEVYSPNRLTYTTSIEAALHLILTGSYIGALPLHYVTEWVRKKKVRVLLRDELSHKFEFFAFYNSNRINTAIISQFWSLLFKQSGSE